jgi:alpha-beta hydrolase superfamily lysophospholipase
VRNNVHFTFATRVRSEIVSLHLYPHAFHDLLMETDDVREDALQKILVFLASESS